jgi:hypothetical protein
MALALGGCATTNGAALAQMEGDAPLRLVVVQSPMTVDAPRLQAVLAPGSKRKLSLSDEPIAQGVQRAELHAQAAMQFALGGRSGLDVVATPERDKALIDRLADRSLGMSLSQDDANRIAADADAEAVLRFRMTDYGLTPRAWRDAYIAFEVTSTLAIAGAIAYSGSAVAGTAAGAYLAQETVEETAEAYAGFWGLNVVSRPVRMTAELVRLDPVATVWQDSRTGLSDVELSRLTRRVGPRETARQLDQSTADAAGELASDLSAALASSVAVRPPSERDWR